MEVAFTIGSVVVIEVAHEVVPLVVSVVAVVNRIALNVVVPEVKVNVVVVKSLVCVNEPDKVVVKVVVPLVLEVIAVV